MPKLPLTDNLSLIMTSQKNLCLLTCLLFELRSTHREREREREVGISWSGEYTLFPTSTKNLKIIFLSKNRDNQSKSQRIVKLRGPLESSRRSHKLQ